jgi:Kef-type K+ transport system membrane component KefB
MELIILNIGLQHGIIQPPLFSIMILMAVVTTLMASPVFELVYGRHARRMGELGEIHEADAAPEPKPVRDGRTS